MHEFAPANRTDGEIARLVKTVVTPRPIAWISTVSDAGVDTLVPFSSYNYVSLEGAHCAVHAERRAKRTEGYGSQCLSRAANSVVNIVTEADIERMDHTSAALPEDESEFDLVDIERGESRTVFQRRASRTRPSRWSVDSTIRSRSTTN